MFDWMFSRDESIPCPRVQGHSFACTGTQRQSNKGTGDAHTHTHTHTHILHEPYSSFASLPPTLPQLFGDSERMFLPLQNPQHFLSGGASNYWSTPPRSETLFAKLCFVRSLLLLLCMRVAGQGLSRFSVVVFRRRHYQ